MSDISDLLDDIPAHDKRKYLNERIAQTGWTARQMLKLERALSDDLHGKTYLGDSRTKSAYFGAIHLINKAPPVRWMFDKLFTYYIIGDLTGEDQEMYCQLHDNHVSPKKITLINAGVLGTGLICLDYLISYGSGSIPHANLLLKYLSVSTEHAFLGIGCVEMAWNMVRMGYALKTGKGLEGVGFRPLLFNSMTYVKRIKRRLSGDAYSTYGSTYVKRFLKQS